ncbi:conserved hypothetical protein [Vibrio chagasii]|nr:conserved hypothetical protein [Vibrio chagasii]
MSHNRLKLVVANIILVFVFGCKDNNDSKLGQGKESAGEKIDFYLTQATFNVPNNEGFLDLTPHIKFETTSGYSNDIEYELDVKPSAGLEQQCFVNSQIDEGFYFNKTQEACVYNFTVRANTFNGSSMAKTSKVRIISSSEEDVLLSPTSHVMKVGEQDELVIASLPQGYVLNEIIVVDGSAIATLTSDGSMMVIDASAITQSELSIIEYTAIAAENNRVNIASAKDEAESISTLNSIKIGQVYVTTQELGYVSVSAESGHLPDSNDGRPKDLPLNTEIVVDISPFVQAGTYDYQLFEVKSTTADVRPEENNNKAFSFKTSQQGRHYVYYMVYDSTVSGSTAGGYSGNVITIDVSIPKTWGRLVNREHKIFSAPQTYFETLVYRMEDRFSDFELNSFFDEGVQRHMAVMSKNSASIYCDFIGSVPLKNHIDDLIASEIAKQYAWPLDKPYIYFDVFAGDYQGVDLNTGRFLTLNANDSVYAACQQGITSTHIRTTDGEVLPQINASLTIKLKEFYPVGNSRISISSPLIAEVTSGSALHAGSNLKKKTKYSNEKGEITFEFVSNVVGESQVTVTNPNSLNSSKRVVYPIDFK